MTNDNPDSTGMTLFVFYTVIGLLAFGAVSFAINHNAESTAHTAMVYEEWKKIREAENLKPSTPFTDSLGLSNTVEDAVFLCRREAIKHIKTNPKATLPFVQKMFTQCMIKRKATI